MRKLFIIGNGFDIAHGLATKYSDFKIYLQENYLDENKEYPILPELCIMPDGEEGYNDYETVNFLTNLIDELEGEDWNNLESALGNLSFEDYFEVIDFEEDNEWHTVYMNEDVSLNIKEIVEKIKEYFYEWIDTIDIFDANEKKDFSKIIDVNRDVFLTFNYTETLEKIYKAKNIYHIHGKQGEEVIFGHGNEEDYYNKYIEYIGSETSMSELYKNLKKDTQNVIYKSRNFFESLSDIEEIYSYGFSFSDVDMIYIQKLCNTIPTNNIVWYINDYGKDNLDYIKGKIRKSGFKGRFDTFRVQG